MWHKVANLLHSHRLYEFVDSRILEQNKSKHVAGFLLEQSATGFRWFQTALPIIRDF